ncbi:MAG TPA: peptidase domain-containing ABC transporter [Pirellulales bacterium]|nr:peptidase domain-containing ABC transporter [Pirellulales bacterium]
MFRHTIVRQNDRSDCGAAALATLALHHGIRCGLETLRELSATDRDGANLLGLQRAAEKLGFSAKPVRASVEALPALPLPAIAHLRNAEGAGHFVVIHRLRRGRVTLADPGQGLVRMPLDEFAKQWSGNLLLAVPTVRLDPCGIGNSVSPWQRLVELLRSQQSIMLEATVCALCLTLLAIATSYFVQHLVDSVLVRQETKLLNALGVGMVAVVAFRALFNWLRQYLLAHAGRKVHLVLLSGYMRHLLRLPMRFFETRQLGDIVSRMGETARLREAINGTLTSALVDGTVVVGILSILWAYDMPLALVTSAVVPIFLVTVALHHSSGRRRVQNVLESNSHLTTHMVEDIGGIETIKLFAAEQARTEKGEERILGLVQSVFALQTLEIRVQSLAMFITGLASIAVLWFGGHRVIAGALSVGELLFFYTLLLTMLEPLNRLAMVNLKLQDALAAIDRLFQIMDLQTESTSEKKIAFTDLESQIEFRNVGFGYNNRAMLFEGLDLKVAAGQTVAIVGSSGSGKSTLLKLLLAEYEPTEGQILLDGVDIRDIDLESLRRRIAVVSQDPYIFNGTIRQNLSLADEQAPLTEIVAAAKAAGLEEFINGLPQRYETLIGERGVNLSGGQRQRLAIARAILGDPAIVVFDEATSHLDTVTEQAIQHSLRAFLAGRTVLIIAHRLSTVQDADRICVLDGGRFVEQGTNHELLAARGPYARLWQAQTPRTERCRCADDALPVSLSEAW